MAERLYNADDVRSKLHRSIILVGGQPAWVDCATLNGDTFTVTFCDRRLGARTVDYTKPDVSYDEIPLGFLNHNLKAHYFYPVPIRHSRLGLRIENIGSRSGHAINDYISTPSFIDCVKGDYPSYDRCLEIISKAEIGSSMAFHRHYCVERTKKKLLSVLHVDEPIGYVENGSLIPCPGFSNKVLLRIINRSSK